MIDATSQNEYLDLINRVLNLEFNLGLRKEIRFGNNVYDFADTSQNTFVAFFDNSDSINRDKVIIRLQNESRQLRASVGGNNVVTFISVFNGDLDDIEKEYYQQNLIKNKGFRYKFFGVSDIKKIAQKYNLILEDEPIVKFGNRSRYFAVGSVWNGRDDQSKRFFKDGIWENGHENKYVDQINVVRVKDKLILKSSFQRKGEAILRIKALGEVLENPQDGHLLLVRWFPLNEHIDILNFGFLRSAFQEISLDVSEKILTTITNKYPDFLSRIIGVNLDKDIRDKVPFHLDKVVHEDQLGREPVAKAFVEIIKKDIFRQDMDHSFMVHLQGEWGAGKSTFLNLIRKHLNSGNDNWIVVNYNAWQNQHLSPPWWTLIDQVYQQTKTQFDFWFRSRFKLGEWYRRTVWYRSKRNFFSLVLVIVFCVLLYFTGNGLFDFLINNTVSNENVENSVKGVALEVFVKLIVSLGAMTGVIYSFSKLLSSIFFMNSTDEAVLFMSRASDPMTRIKNHFSKLVDGINDKKSKRQLAIFIDDIDRCNNEFIVELLEGIQTLFRDKRVLYIVAGDKNWISTSFENNYKDFDTEQNNKTKLGELFLEKVFQLSIRMPNVSEDAKERYWNHILGLPKEDEKKISFEELSDEEKVKVRNELNESKDISNPEFMKKIEDNYNLTGDTVSNMVIERKNDETEEIRHLLKGFHTLIDSNPRSIVRLANNYTMTRSILIAERREFSPEKLFRWLILKGINPSLISLLESENSDTNRKQKIDKIVKDGILTDKVKFLLFDEENIHGGTLTVNDINNFEGI